MKIGYASVSTQDQNLDRQIDQLNTAGFEKIFQEKIIGTKKDRPELDRLLDQIRPCDVIIIADLTRLSRSTKDLFTLVEQIEKKGANIKSLKETWVDTTAPQGKLMFTIFFGSVSGQKRVWRVPGQEEEKVASLPKTVGKLNWQ